MRDRRDDRIDRRSTARRRAAIAVLVAGVTAVGAIAIPRSAPIERESDTVSFARDVRPILVRSCLACHGFDPSTRAAGLRLDRFEHATAARSRGRDGAIVPGDPDASELLARVAASDPHDRMPPEGEPLSTDEIDVLRRWIEQGAAYESHWSLAPIDESHGDATTPGAIDAFIDARLADAGLSPAPRADRRAQLRRLSFDLIGLPPTPKEIDAFVADDEPGAWERQVDRLLASPRFGERWARHWLDLVRYAETYGHEFDYPVRNAWRYRDAVIRAFNDDVPYDRFVREHVAGDLLDDPRLDPATGVNDSALLTGFWWMHQATHAPVDVRADEAERLDNQIDVFSKTFLATTVACARCHDHKFDPILTSEYYGLAAILASTRRRDAYLDPGGRITEGVETLRSIDARIDRLIADALEEAPGAVTADAVADVADEADGGAPIAFGIGVSGLDPGLDPATDAAFTATGWAFDDAHVRPGEPVERDASGAVALRAHVDSARHGARLVGTMRSGDAVITSPFLAIRARGRGTLRVIVDGYTMDEYNALLFERMRIEVDAAEWTWFVHDLSKYVGHRMHVEWIDDRLDGGLAITDARWVEADDASGLPSSPVTSVSAGAERTASERERLTELDELLARRAEIEAAIPGPERATIALDGPGFDGVVSVRGDWRQPGDPAPRVFPGALVEDPSIDVESGSGRLGLAARVFDRSNPMTARVIVNRAWHHLLGRGIVPTTDDFGLLGDVPSHPELLDALAASFRAEMNWSIKTLLRAIVTSEAYRRATAPLSARAREIDPTNALLSVRSPKRLEGEALRDALLAISGRLDTTMGGPGVPIHLTPFMTGRGRPGGSGPLDGDGRRSIYVEVRRNFAVPMMQAFDTPNPHSTVGCRARSNVPAQSLILMNDPFVAQQAELLAARVQEEASSTDERLDRLMRLAIGRAPDAPERARMRAFLDDVATDEDAGDPWRELAHAIVNLKEFSFIE